MGSKDLRVPMQQAVEYYKMLKARNGAEKARLLEYPKCQHSLNDTIDQEFDAWTNVWAWNWYHLRGTDQVEKVKDNVVEMEVQKVQEVQDPSPSTMDMIEDEVIV